MNDPAKAPYKELGKTLKSVRIGSKESLAEASGAVEIDQDELQNIEMGRKCPSEEVLLLLISHFEVSEEEATRLWDLAGYDKQQSTESRQAIVMLPMDSRIVYSDQMQVTVNKYGVIMNFNQATGNGSQMAVARVGMSKEHAQKILQILTETLSQSEEVAKSEAVSESNPAESSDKS
jgi:hypothetical protein